MSLVLKLQTASMASGSSASPAPAGPHEIPGAPKELASKALETGMSMVQSFKPINKICQHVCAFHCYAHDASRQVLSHHFCSHINEDFRQCVIYDSGAPDARLIGIEYIIAGHLYEQLPEEEKKYWHSHAYEVSSGQLVAETVPTTLENHEMAKLIGTYGKTWHTWQVDRGDALPLGPAQLMMSFTGDGQLDEELLKARDADMGVSTDAKRQARAHLVPPGGWPVHPASDQPWRTNLAMETQVVQTQQPFMPPGMPGIGQIGGVNG